MSKSHTHLIWICLLLAIQTTQAAYTITGKVNLDGQWQQTIYLATIDKLDDYYSANAEYIINTAEIDKNGTFVLTGDNLPGKSQFYKIYLLKEEHSEFNACLYEGGDDHNFIHIVLNNDTNLQIIADDKVYAPFGDYKIKGDQENQLMKKLTAMVYPSYLFYEIRFPSELKLSQDKLMKDLFVFADTCTSPLIGLAAINTTDYDAYFEYHTDAYYAFAERLKKQIPDHPYTQDYQRKLRYHGNDYAQNNNPLIKWIAGFLFLLSAFLMLQNLKLRKQLSTAEKSKEASKKPIAEKVHLTQQELKILSFIREGKSNKEIASSLFIEVSTVKSHINRLYTKLQVKNRQEAREMSKKPEFQGF